MSGLCLLIHSLLPHSHLVPTDIFILVYIFDHMFLSFDLPCLTIIDHLLILNSLIFDSHGLCLIPISDYLGGDHTIISLGSDSRSLEDDTLMMLLKQRLPFLTKLRDTCVNSFFSTKLLWRTSTIRWYLFLACSISCLLRRRSTSR